MKPNKTATNSEQLTDEQLTKHLESLSIERQAVLSQIAYVIKSVIIKDLSRKYLLISLASNLVVVFLCAIVYYYFHGGIWY